MLEYNVRTEGVELIIQCRIKWIISILNTILFWYLLKREHFLKLQLWLSDNQFHWPLIESKNLHSQSYRKNKPKQVHKYLKFNFMNNKKKDMSHIIKQHVLNSLSDNFPVKFWWNKLCAKAIFKDGANKRTACQRLQSGNISFYLIQATVQMLRTHIWLPVCLCLTPSVYLCVYFMCLHCGGSDLRKPGKQWGTTKTNRPTRLGPTSSFSFTSPLSSSLDKNSRVREHAPPWINKYLYMHKRIGRSRSMFTCTAITWQMGNQCLSSQICFPIFKCQLAVVDWHTAWSVHYWFGLRPELDQST